MNLIDSMEAAGIAQFPKTRREELLIEFFQAHALEAVDLRTEAEDTCASFGIDIKNLNTEIKGLETKLEELDRLQDEADELKKQNEALWAPLN